MKRSLLALALCLPLASCAAPTEEKAPQLLSSSQPIQGGQIDNDDANVVGLFMMTGGMCTGTLIAPNLVLTARHCISEITPDMGGAVQCGVSKFSMPYSGSTVQASTDTQLQIGWGGLTGTKYAGSEVRVPSEGNGACGFDVALVYLAESMPVEPRVPRIDVPPEAGEPYTAVGYGMQADNAQWTSGTRMVRSGLTVQCRGNDCPSYYDVQSSEFQGETGICSGDSGGPAIDANGKVIGVVSRGLPGCDAPTYGSVSTWRDFIIQGAIDAAAKGGYNPPFWALSGKSDPEPGTGGTGGSSGVDPVQGRACSPSQACPGGYSCVSDGSPDQGYCAAQCDAQNPCGGWLQCGDLGVCVAAQADNGSSNSSSGCSVGGGSERGPVKPVPWVVGAIGLAFGAWRRRRRARALT